MELKKRELKENYTKWNHSHKNGKTMFRSYDYGETNFFTRKITRADFLFLKPWLK